MRRARDWPRPKQIGARDDADQITVTQDRETLDAFLLHDLNDVFQCRVLGDRHRIARHHVADGAPLFLDEFGRQLAWADEKLQPAGAAMPRADLTAAKEIAFGHDPHEMALGIDDRQAAHPLLKHQFGCLRDRGVDPHGRQPGGHNLISTHVPSSSTKLIEAIA